MRAAVFAFRPSSGNVCAATCHRLFVTDQTSMMQPQLAAMFGASKIACSAADCSNVDIGQCATLISA